MQGRLVQSGAAFIVFAHPDLKKFKLFDLYNGFTIIILGKNINTIREGKIILFNKKGNLDTSITLACTIPLGYEKDVYVSDVIIVK